MNDYFVINDEISYYIFLDTKIHTDDIFRMWVEGFLAECLLLLAIC